MLSNSQSLLVVTKENSRRDMVLMLVPYRNRQRGNVLTARRILRGLRKRGFAIQCISLEDTQGLEVIKAGLAARRFGLVHGFHGLHMARALDQLPELEEIPLLLTTTGTDIHSDLRGSARDQVLKSFYLARYLVIFNSEFKPLINEYYPDVDKKLVVIPQGIWLEKTPPESRLRWGLENRDAVFVLPSGLRPVKNIELAIEGMTLLHETHPQTRLVVMGAVLDANYGRLIMNRIKSRDWIKYLGEVDHQKVGAVYNLADAVINCSQAEGQPQAALEVMSLGKPALLSVVPGNLGIIEDGLQGYYFRDSRELAARARILVDHPELFRSMGDAARETVLERFSLKQELQAYELLYGKLLYG